MPNHGRTYECGAVFSGQGVFFATLGLAVISWVMYHSLKGMPLMMSNGRGSDSSHPASNFELATLGLGGVITAGGGLLSCIAGKRMRVITNREGITATNLFGKPKFHARWQDLERLDNRRSRTDRYYSLESQGKRMDIDSRYVGFLDLIKEIRKRAPQISETYYD